ncbi:hypothetical protein [Streptantibioticus ferralitis]|uniref:Syndecan 1 n=1 Tax=Streptantibioticus ferralitis TaxID=236510 RepID=A0ABT5Z171_9ACTN|nr:hypothetical protein [Streptantibioticus ferralitis]MDF2257587.1 hypothetical protein [Streptantibioticus ferralitis]
MGFWDRFARRAGGGAADDVRAPRAGADAPHRSDTGGDGGWRAVPPLATTVAGAAGGVSDGLRFRSRLAAWQNPSLSGALRHAVLPSAPAGLLRAVARPLAPATFADADDPELPYAAPPQASEPDEPTEAGTEPVPPVQRSRAARRRLRATPAAPAAPGDDGAAPSVGRARPQQTGLVLLRPIGEPLTVAPPPRPFPTRAVTVVPPRGAQGPVGATPTHRSATEPEPAAADRATATARPSAASAPIPAERTGIDPEPAVATARPPVASVPIVVRRSGVDGGPVAASDFASARDADGLGQRGGVGEGGSAMARPPVASVPIVVRRSGVDGGPVAASDFASARDADGLGQRGGAGEGASAVARPPVASVPIVVQRSGADAGPVAASDSPSARDTDDLEQRGGAGGTASARPVLGAPLTSLPASASTQHAADGLGHADDAPGPASSPMRIVPSPTQPIGLTESVPGGPGPSASAPPPGGSTHSHPAPERRDGTSVQRAPYEGGSSVGPPPAAPGAQPTTQPRAGTADARTRGGLGAPLNALPPTAGVPDGTAPLLGRRRPARRITDTAAAGVGTDGASGSAPEHVPPTVPTPPRSAARTGMPLRTEGVPVDVSVPGRPFDAALNTTALQRTVDGGRPDPGRGPAPGDRGADANEQRDIGAPTAGRGAASAPQPIDAAPTSSSDFPSRQPSSGPRGSGITPQPPAGAAERDATGALGPARHARSVGGGETARRAVPQRDHGPTVVARSPTGGIAPHATAPVQHTRGLLGERPMVLDLRAPAAAPATDTGSAAARATPVVGAVWVHDLPRRADGRSAAEPATPRTRRRRATGVPRLPKREEARHQLDDPRPAPPADPPGAAPDVRPSEPRVARATAPAPGPPVPDSPRGATAPSPQPPERGPAPAGRPIVQRSVPGGPRSTGPNAQPALPGTPPGSAAAPARRVRRGDRDTPPVAVPASPLRRGTEPSTTSRGGPGTSVPLVRLAAPGGVTGRSSVQRLPVGAGAARPSLARSPSGPARPWRTAEEGAVTPGASPEPAPLPSVASARTASWTQQARGDGTSTPVPAPRTAASRSRRSADTARVLQRVAEQAGLSGVPLTAVPSRTRADVAPVAEGEASAAGSPAEASAGSPTGAAAGVDINEIDELARRLIEPVGRLLRAELRRGRERAGRPYDGRR